MLDLTTAFAAFPTMQTERFLLREPALEDADSMFRIMADPQVMRYFGHPPMALRDEAVDRINSMQSNFRQQLGVRWAIVDRESGEYIGSGGFWRLVKPHFRAEIGYELSPAWWGRGVMTEAIYPMLQFAFTSMGLHSIEAQIHPDNTGSRRVLEKLGFTQEGYFRQNYFEPATNSFTDTAVFSLLRSDFAP